MKHHELIEKVKRETALPSKWRPIKRRRERRKVIQYLNEAVTSFEVNFGEANMDEATLIVETETGAKVYERKTGKLLGEIRRADLKGEGE